MLQEYDADQLQVEGNGAFILNTIIITYLTM